MPASLTPLRRAQIGARLAHVHERLGEFTQSVEVGLPLGPRARFESPEHVGAELSAVIRQLRQIETALAVELT